MNVKEDIKPITYMKTRSSELLRQVNEIHRPVVITQNGEAKAVVQDMTSYQQTRDALLMNSCVPGDGPTPGNSEHPH